MHSSTARSDNKPDIHQNEEAPRTHCVRCGTCCMRGGPALHVEDLELLKNDAIKRSSLYTVRRGETVFNNVAGKPSVLSEEIIKIKGTGQSHTCIFYDEKQKGCAIYENRPIECRLLKCWDTKDLEAVYEKNRLQRRRLIPSDTAVAQIIATHDQKCSYLALETLIQKLEGPEAEDAVEKVLELLHFDHNLRPLVAQRLELPIEEMDFFFGRPLTTTIRMFGLQVKQEGETFFLSPIEQGIGEFGN
ncbi:MAG: YkgJ family cysteine cluster protein [Pseudomonadota bacterium]